VHWIHHLDDYVQAENEPRGTMMASLEDFLREFLQKRWPVTPAVDLSDTTKTESGYRVFKSTDFFLKLLYVVSLARSNRAVVYSRPGVSEGESYLLAQLDLVRSEFEKVASSLTPGSSEFAKYHKYYGQDWFKCQRMTCGYFYKGFDKQLHRDEHFKKHDRPFRCSFIGCHGAITGSQSARDLAKHMSEYHPTAEEGKQTFPSRYQLSLKDAVRMGDLNEVNQHLEGWGLKSSKPFGPLLKIAAEEGHDAIFERLLVLLGIKYTHKLQALFSAMAFGHESIVNTLVADMNLKDGSRDFQVLLIQAAWHNNVHALKLAAPKCKKLSSAYPNTALETASGKGHEAIVSTLLEFHRNGQLLEQSDLAKSLKIALQNGHEIIAQLLTPWVSDGREAERWRVSQLITGAREGNEDDVREIILKGQVSLNSRSETGFTPLMLASSRGHKSIVEMLLADDSVDVNADIDSPLPSSILGKTALFFAADMGHESVVRLLLAHGKTVTSQYAYLAGFDPQFEARAKGHDLIANLIRDHERRRDLPW
jgi:hypothetical protein